MKIKPSFLVVCIGNAAEPLKKALKLTAAEIINEWIVEKDALEAATKLVSERGQHIGVYKLVAVATPSAPPAKIIDVAE